MDAKIFNKYMRLMKILKVVEPRLKPTVAAARLYQEGVLEGVIK